MSKQTQKAWVFAQLKKGKTITALDAFNGCGAMRLAALIYDLRNEGHPITTETVYSDTKHWAKYRLARSKK